MISSQILVPIYAIAPSILEQTQRSESYAALLHGLQIGDPSDLQRWLRSNYAEPCQSTIDTYKKNLKRFQTRHLSLQSKVSVRLMRAALLYSLTKSILAVDRSDRKRLEQRARYWRHFVRLVTSPQPHSDEHKCTDQGFLRLASYLKTVGVLVKGPDSEAFPRRKGRVQKVSALPPDWRETIFENVNTQIPNMREALLTLALSGCRPSELRFATLTSAGNGKIKIEVCSGKSLAGNPEEGSQGIYRGGIFKIPEITIELLELATEPSRGKDFPFVRISPKQIENVLSRTSQKQGVSKKIGLKITAYDFRNQAASDAKNVGFTDEELALFLGHVTNLEQRVYGRARYGSRSQISWLPEVILNSHGVRLLKTRFPRHLDVNPQTDGMDDSESQD